MKITSLFRYEVDKAFHLTRFYVRRSAIGCWVLRKAGKSAAQPLEPIMFGSLRRLDPVSTRWGDDRGVPMDRYYIEKFLSEHASDVRGRVLEVQENDYTTRFGGNRVEKSDILSLSPQNEKATIIADLAKGDALPSEAFDCIILTQTLHLIYDVRGTLQTVYRILKPGGVLLVTVPGISKICRDELGEWADCWRFTAISCQRLFGEFFPSERLSVASFGNILSAVGFLHGLAVHELTLKELEYHDPDYEVIIGVRAVKPTA